jgi:hypothetical protein
MNGLLCGIPIREVLRRYDEFDRLERKVAYLEEIREGLLERVDDQQGQIIHLNQQNEDLRDEVDFLTRQRTAQRVVIKQELAKREDLIADNRKLRLEKRARGLQLERLMDKLVAALSDDEGQENGPLQAEADTLVDQLLAGEYRYWYLVRSDRPPVPTLTRSDLWESARTDRRFPVESARTPPRKRARSPVRLAPTPSATGA